MALVLKPPPGAGIQARKTPTVLPPLMGTGTTLALTFLPSAVRTTRTARALVSPRIGHAVALPGAAEPASATSGSTDPAMPTLPGTPGRCHAGHWTSSVAPRMGVRNVAQHTSPCR